MDSRETQNEDNQRTMDEIVRKPYQKPRLEVYGDLADLSASVAGNMHADGLGHPNKHFTS